MCDQLFNDTDLDDNGLINLEEFIDDYHNRQRYYIEEIENLELRISDQVQRMDAIKKRLEEIRVTERYTQYTHPMHPDRRIMKGSTLTVHVIDARGLRSRNGVANA